MKSGPRLAQLEKAHAQKRKPNTAKNKINKIKKKKKNQTAKKKIKKKKWFFPTYHLSFEFT